MSPFTSSSTHKEGKRTKRFNHSKFFRVTLLIETVPKTTERERKREGPYLTSKDYLIDEQKKFLLMNALGENMRDKSILGE